MAKKRSFAAMELIPDGRRSIGTTAQGPGGRLLQVAGEVKFHRSLEERFGRSVEVILDEKKNKRLAQVYLPANASRGTLTLYQ